MRGALGQRERIAVRGAVSLLKQVLAHQLAIDWDGLTQDEFFEQAAERIAALEASNAQLRALVKAAETSGLPQYPLDQQRVNCPWCQCDTVVGKKRHDRYCPAFTPDGVVK